MPKKPASLAGASRVVVPFALTIVVGTILLRLPIAASGQPMTWIDSLFTAASARLGWIGQRANRAQGGSHGTNEYIASFHHQGGQLPLRNPAIKAACAVGVISCGGSTGPLGCCVAPRFGAWRSAWPDSIVGLGILLMTADAGRKVFSAAGKEHCAAKP